MSERYSSDEWSRRFDEIVLQHSEELGFSDEYGDYLEHKFKIPGLNIEIPDIKLPKINLPKLKIPDSIKSSLNTPISKAKEKLSSLNKSSESSSTGAARPAKWIWPNGKNSKEYNHWYWETFKDKIKVKRGQSSEGHKLAGPIGYYDTVPWEKATEETKKAFEDYWNNKMKPQERSQYKNLQDFYNKNMKPQSEHYSNYSEMFLSQFIQRPLSILTLNVGSYLLTAARDVIATASYVKTAVLDIKRKVANEQVDNRTGFKIQSEPNEPTLESIADDVNEVNPGFANWNTNTKQNCILCTSTYDMRRRGYDVTAKTTGMGYDTEDIHIWYPDAEVKAVHYDSSGTGVDTQQDVRTRVEMFEQECIAQGEGARGNIMVAWQGGGGHSMAYEVLDGHVYIVDAQSNTIYVNPYDILQNTTGDLEYARLDNIDFDPEQIKRCSRS